MSSGIESIRSRLLDVARRYSVYDGSEIAEAKSLLDLLFAAYGTDRGTAVCSRSTTSELPPKQLHR